MNPRPVRIGVTSISNGQRLAQRALIALIALASAITSTHIIAAPGSAARTPRIAHATAGIDANVPILTDARLATSFAAGPDQGTPSSSASFSDPSSSPSLQTLIQRRLCADDFFGLSITLSQSKLPGQLVSFTVFAPDPNVVMFAWSPSGPFTETLEIPIQLDGSGYGKSATFVVKAVGVGVTLVEGCSPNPVLGCLDAVDVTVAGISSVEFLEIDGPLDPNPNVGGGLRIYPDKQTGTDTIDRRTVRVKALASEAIAGMPIAFRAFDVDDPSSDSRPIDRTGSAGNDNNGQPLAGTLSSTFAKTDLTGTAEVTLTVSMQPGDNYRVAASCSPSYLFDVEASSVDLIHENGQVLPNASAGVTDMLTVWRRVHIEVDSMGEVTGNNVKGTILKVEPDAYAQTSGLDLLLSFDRRLDRHRFTGGRIAIDGIGAFAVVDNGGSSLKVTGLVPPSALAQTFTLVDDDDFNGNDGADVDGDEGENLFAPSLTYLNDGLDNGICDNSDKNVLGPAYVCALTDVGDNNDYVPFVLNTPSTASGKLATYDFDQAVTQADPNYWTVYLLGAYQNDEPKDFDGEVSGVLGTVDNINGVGASIFLESTADAERDGFVLGCSQSVIVVHELGHLFSGTHAQGGLMDSPCTKSGTAFSDQTITTIRKLDHP